MSKDIILNVGDKVHVIETDSYGEIIARFDTDCVNPEAHPYGYRTDCDGTRGRYDLELVGADELYKAKEEIWRLRVDKSGLELQVLWLGDDKKALELDKGKLEITIGTLERNVTDVRKLYDDLKLELDTKAQELAKDKLETLAGDLEGANQEISNLKAEVETAEEEKENFQSAVGEIEAYVEELDKDLHMYIRPTERTIQEVLYELQHITAKV